MIRDPDVAWTRRDRVLRMRFVAGGLWLGLALLALRLAQLQLVDAERWRAERDRQSSGERPVRGARGAIYLADGTILAASIQVPSLAIDPSEVRDPDETARRLSEVVGIPAEDLAARLRSPSRFVWVRRRVSDETAQRARALGLHGLRVVPEFLRVYPQGATAAHVVGFAGIDGVGLEGIERSADPWLDAPDLRARALVDAARRVVAFENSMPAPPTGLDVVLTIDLELQRAMEGVLAEGAWTTKADHLFGVALDPATGAILAMASWPSFDPNDLPADPNLRRNRALTDPFEPGSVVKPFVLAEALERGVVTRETRIDCGRGALRVGPRLVRDHKALFERTAEGVIIVSSNIGAAIIGQLVGGDWLRAMWLRMGFARASGVELPGEAGGRVPSARKWTSFTTVSSAFGYEILVTPLQLARAFAALANGGYLVRPHLVSAVRDDRGVDLYRAEPELEGPVFRPETCAALREVLAKVVRDGTGREAAVPGLEVAGKTGTAIRFDPVARRYDPAHNISTFAAMAPASDPRIVVVISVVEPRGETYAGRVAAPVARSFLSAWHEHEERSNPVARNVLNMEER